MEKKNISKYNKQNKRMKSKAQKAVDQCVQESNDSTQILPEPSAWVQSKQTENTNPSILGTPRADKRTIYNMSLE